MNVKNRAVIRRLSLKTLWASRKRNMIAVIAIALTALLFTSLFTILLSLNKSWQEYTFRQIGGYSHGTFKEVTPEQTAAISVHPGVKETGLRTNIGILTTGAFAKTPAELSFMDENCTTWSYAKPTMGQMPESGKEITMDTAALALLGIEPKIGAEVELTWQVEDRNNAYFEKTDTFTLAGWWDYDNISPVHYINVSKEYVRKLQEETGYEFRSDLNVMLPSALDMEGQMEQVDTDLGYTWDMRGAENNVRIGVNWGYTSAQLLEGMDGQTIISIFAVLALVMFTGYLIIYNIFQISVSGDIRFYGLLKTIGVTPRQLQRIIRFQALALCTVGIPAGLILGYGVGALLVPQVMKNTSMSNVSALSASPVIFLFSAVFALVTVLLSCARPGKIAAGVSPVEAVRYTEHTSGKRKRKRTYGAGVWQMAFANLGRNRLKTALVVISLSLSVVLLNLLAMLVGGFDMEKYLANRTCADFIVSSTDYFRYSLEVTEFISEEEIEEIRENTNIVTGGSGYTVKEKRPQVWMEEAVWRKGMEQFAAGELLEQYLSMQPRRDSLVADNAQILGLDMPLFEKLQVAEGDLTPLTAWDLEQKAIALAVYTDDYGNISNLSFYPKIGETVTITYAEEDKDVTYTVCAYVVIPYSMGYRYSTTGYKFVLPTETLAVDSGQEIMPLYYLFDTPDEESEAAAEEYLSERTGSDVRLMYESKATLREEFRSFQKLFLLLGGLLCAIIGVVGILNFFNAIMTGILARQREFAVLQAVGMTERQLKATLVLEGLFYALGSALLALMLSVALNPLAGNLMENMFWFFKRNHTLAPVLVSLPVFALLGCLIPSLMYRQSTGTSVVERLREAG